MLLPGKDLNLCLKLLYNCLEREDQRRIWAGLKEKMEKYQLESIDLRRFLYFSDRRFQRRVCVVQPVRAVFRQVALRIISAAFSAIMIVGAFVLPRVMAGMIEASTIRRLFTP